MANPWRGELRLVIDGQPHRLRLTLGALAELEEALGEEGLPALFARFEEGRFRAGDVLALLTAGLRGGGWSGEARDLLNAEIEGGIAGAAAAAARLLVLSLAGPGQAAAHGDADAEGEG